MIKMRPMNKFRRMCKRSENLEKRKRKKNQLKLKKKPKHQKNQKRKRKNNLSKMNPKRI